MSKSVLISINPKWCNLIAKGKKTIEVRKTMPKIDVPFKCYIYCTSSNIHECLMQNESGVKLIHCINYKTAISCGGEVANGKIIGEFVCDEIYHIKNLCTKFLVANDEKLTNMIGNASCLDFWDVRNYLQDKDGYAWHISDLVIYDKPKELGEFYTYIGEGDCCGGCIYHECPVDTEPCRSCQGDRKYLYRPPQSWCYVEDLGE